MFAKAAINILTVSQLNKYIAALIDNCAPLKRLYVKGELSDFKRNAFSGHCYFSLKDDSGKISCIMYSSVASKLRFEPENGMTVICFGRVSVYDKNGVYQLVADDIIPDGVGEMYLALNRLKEKLEKEGLFDESRKKPLPKFPSKIGVATSNTGAAVEDIKNIAARRYPLAEIIIVPTVVQGAQAAEDIVKSIEFLDGMGDIDVIIFGRGGGSADDLWCFNDERVVRAVAACKTPIVSAVGHKTDSPLCDFAADVAVPTPSAAAERVCPDFNELYSALSQIKSRLFAAVNGVIDGKMRELSDITGSPVLENYEALICSYSEKVNELRRRINERLAYIIESKEALLSLLAGKLNALSPLAVLSRGYLIGGIGGSVIKSVSQIKSKDSIDLTFSDGKAKAEITEVINNG